MDGYQKRLTQVRSVLSQAGLPSSAQMGPGTRPPSEKQKSLFLQRREGHVLQVVGFPDGALAVVLHAEGEKIVRLGLLAKPGGAWQVVGAGELHRSPTLHSIWQRLPDREDAIEGLIAEKDSECALHCAVDLFASLATEAEQRRC